MLTTLAQIYGCDMGFEIVMQAIKYCWLPSPYKKSPGLPCGTTEKIFGIESQPPRPFVYRCATCPNYVFCRQSNRIKRYREVLPYLCFELLCVDDELQELVVVDVPAVILIVAPEELLHLSADGRRRKADTYK